jgi:hypothetical protein
MADSKKPVPVSGSEPDPFDQVLDEFERQAGRLGRFVGRGLIRAGNVLTGRALTAEDSQKLIGEMRRRELFFDEGRKRGEPRYITRMRWMTEEFDRLHKKSATPPKA